RSASDLPASAVWPSSYGRDTIDNSFFHSFPVSGIAAAVFQSARFLPPDQCKITDRLCTKPDLSDNTFLIYHTDGGIPAVLAAVSIISKNKIFILAQGERFFRDAGIVDRRHVFLRIRLSVDRHLSFMDHDRLSRQSDDPLDMNAGIAVLVQTKRYDISPLRRRKTVRCGVDHHLVSRLQGRIHG